MVSGLLKQFDYLRCADHVKQVKPASELYEAVLKYFELEPTEAIALEDSPKGVLAARRAGIFCVTIPNPLTVGLDFSHANLRLASMAALNLAALIKLAENG